MTETFTYIVKSVAGIKEFFEVECGAELLHLAQQGAESLQDISGQ